MKIKCSWVFKHFPIARIFHSVLLLQSNSYRTSVRRTDMKAIGKLLRPYSFASNFIQWITFVTFFALFFLLSIWCTAYQLDAFACAKNFGAECKQNIEKFITWIHTSFTGTLPVWCALYMDLSIDFSILFSPFPTELLTGLWMYSFSKCSIWMLPKLPMYIVNLHWELHPSELPEGKMMKISVHNIGMAQTSCSCLTYTQLH